MGRSRELADDMNPEGFAARRPEFWWDRRWLEQQRGRQNRGGVESKRCGGAGEVEGGELERADKDRRQG